MAFLSSPLKPGRFDMTKTKLPVMEIFGPTLQGEGAMAGQRSYFVRLGGCPYRCTWCDSMHAVNPVLIKSGKIEMTPLEISQKLNNFAPSKWVTLSGGDPVMWSLSDLLQLLKVRYKIAVETEGYLFAPWLIDCDLITVSPKGPSSGMLDKLNYSTLDRYNDLPQTNFKVVVFDREDLEFAEDIHLRYPDKPFYISVGTPQGKTNKETIDDVLESLHTISEDVLTHPALSDVTVLPQLHVLTWGTKLGV